MDLFPNNPSISAADRSRLSKYLGNASAIKAWIRDKQPSTADLKRAVQMETERGHRMRADVINLLLVSIQRYERSTIGRRILRAKARAIRKASNRNTP